MHNSNEWGYIKKKICRTLLSFLGVFDMKVEWNGIDVFCSIVAYMCGGEWNIIL